VARLRSCVTQIEFTLHRELAHLPNEEPNLRETQGDTSRRSGTARSSRSTPLASAHLPTSACRTGVSADAVRQGNGVPVEAEAWWHDREPILAIGHEPFLPVGEAVDDVAHGLVGRNRLHDDPGATGANDVTNADRRKVARSVVHPHPDGRIDRRQPDLDQRLIGPHTVRSTTTIDVVVSSTMPTGRFTRTIWRFCMRPPECHRNVRCWVARRSRSSSFVAPTCRRYWRHGPTLEAECHGRSPFIAMLDRPCDTALQRIDRRLFYCPTHLIERRFMPAIRLIEKSLPIDD
jgi:hypothetical protein